jgi:hypothetical protein
MGAFAVEGDQVPAAQVEAVVAPGVSYWSSPRVSTTLGWSLRTSRAVARMRQAVAVPRPPRKLRLAGSQAMSPAAAITVEGAGRLVAGRAAWVGRPAAGRAGCEVATRLPRAVASSAGAGTVQADTAARTTTTARMPAASRPRCSLASRRSRRAIELRDAVVRRMALADQPGSTVSRQIADIVRKGDGQPSCLQTARFRPAAVTPTTRR